MINFINGLSQKEVNTVYKLANLKMLLAHFQEERDYIEDLMLISKGLSGVWGTYKIISSTKSLVFISGFKMDEVMKKFIEMNGKPALTYLFITNDFSEFSDLAACEKDYEGEVVKEATELGLKVDTDLEDCIRSMELEIIFEKKIPLGLIDLGSVQLNCEGREYALDVSKSSRNSNCITCQLEVDKEELTDNKYNLTVEDLFNPSIEGTVFISCDFELVDPSVIELTVETVSGKTTTIDLEVE